MFPLVNCFRGVFRSSFFLPKGQLPPRVSAADSGQLDTEMHHRLIGVVDTYIFLSPSPSPRPAKEVHFFFFRKTETKILFFSLLQMYVCHTGFVYRMHDRGASARRKHPVCRGCAGRTASGVKVSHTRCVSRRSVRKAGS